MSLNGPEFATRYNRPRNRMKYRVLIEIDEDGRFVATCPSLPGCVAQGATREEAKAGVREAIAAYVESLKAHDEPVPPPIEEDFVDIPD